MQFAANLEDSKRGSWDPKSIRLPRSSISQRLHACQITKQHIESVCFPQQAPDQRLNGKLDAHIRKESKYLRSIFLLGEINSAVRRATLINSSRAPLVFITGCSSQNRGTAENALAANSSKQTPGAKKAAGEYNNQRASPENMCC